jgi:glycerol uptake facilitator protein
VPNIHRRYLAEVFGTFILVFFGCGAVHAAVLLDAHQGLWQVAIVWGIAVMIACYLFGDISGAHLNPAVTVALAAWGRFSPRDVLPYILGQMVGAYLAAAALFVFFEPFLTAKELEKQVKRGEPGSEVTAMCYGEYFPNPGGFAAEKGPLDLSAFAAAQSKYSLGRAFFVELLGTAVLGLVVFGVTDPRNTAVPDRLAPVFIGLTVTVLISVIAPLTQSCFNPARDLGPRLFASMAGWGEIAWPTGEGMRFLLVYLVAPIAGALLGGGLHTLRIAHDLPPRAVS